MSKRPILQSRDKTFASEISKLFPHLAWKHRNTQGEGEVGGGGMVNIVPPSDKFKTTC